MTFTSKFDLNEEVFFILNNTIRTGIIEDIYLNKWFEYGIACSDKEKSLFIVEEKNTYKTKQELLEAIDKTL